MRWQSGCARNVWRTQDYRQAERTVGVDLANVKTGKGPSFSWRAWSFLLITAEDYGWVPQGTVLDFEYQFASAVGKFRLNDINKRKYEQDIKRFCDGWSGDYDANHAQLVTEEDSRNMLKALIRAVNNVEFQAIVGKDERKHICELMAFLTEGAFRIG